MFYFILGDSEDERERKLLQMQEQLKRMQEQMRILVEESMNSKSRKSKHTSKKVRQWSPLFSKFSLHSQWLKFKQLNHILLFWMKKASFSYIAVFITCFHISLKKSCQFFASLNFNLFPNMIFIPFFQLEIFFSYQVWKIIATR